MQGKALPGQGPLGADRTSGPNSERRQGRLTGASSAYHTPCYSSVQSLLPWQCQPLAMLPAMSTYSHCRHDRNPVTTLSATSAHSHCHHGNISQLPPSLITSPHNHCSQREDTWLPPFPTASLYHPSSYRNYQQPSHSYHVVMGVSPNCHLCTVAAVTLTPPSYYHP